MKAIVCGDGTLSCEVFKMCFEHFNRSTFRVILDMVSREGLTEVGCKKYLLIVSVR